MTQQRAQSADFEPSWPEVAGFGAGPNKHDFLCLAGRRNAKIRGCGHSRIACRFAAPILASWKTLRKVKPQLHILNSCHAFLNAPQGKLVNFEMMKYNDPKYDRGGFKMDYLTVKEAGENWGISSRMVNYYCKDGRIKGAVKKGNLWLIPISAEKPADGRTKTGKLRGEKSCQNKE